MLPNVLPIHRKLRCYCFKIVALKYACNKYIFVLDTHKGEEFLAPNDFCN